MIFTFSSKQFNRCRFTSTGPQGLHDMPPFSRDVAEQKRLLQTLFPVASRNIYFLSGKRVDPSIVHTGGEGARGGGKVLHLLDHELVSPEKNGQFDHIAKGATRMPGHEIRNHAMPFPEASALASETGEKRLEGINPRLAHAGKNPVNGMLRRHLEKTPHMVAKERGKVCGLALQEIKTDPGGYSNMLYTLRLAHLSQQFHGPAVVGNQLWARLRKETAPLPAFALKSGSTAPQAVHICGRPPDIADAPPEPRLLGQTFDFPYNRIYAARLDGLPLVVTDGAESAAAETAAMGGDGGPDLLTGGNRFRV